MGFFSWKGKFVSSAKEINCGFQNNLTWRIFDWRYIIESRTTSETERIARALQMRGRYHQRTGRAGEGPPQRDPPCELQIEMHSKTGR